MTDKMITEPYFTSKKKFFYKNLLEEKLDFNPLKINLIRN